MQAEPIAQTCLWSRSCLQQCGDYRVGQASISRCNSIFHFHIWNGSIKTPWSTLAWPICLYSLLHQEGGDRDKLAHLVVPITAPDRNFRGEKFSSKSQHFFCSVKENCEYRKFLPLFHCWRYSLPPFRNCFFCIGLCKSWQISVASQTKQCEVVLAHAWVAVGSTCTLPAGPVKNATAPNNLQVSS